MQLYDAIHSRRTIHQYTAAPALTDDVMERILNAAHQAPNHKLTWPWRFNVVGPQTRASMVDVGIKLKAPNGHPSTRLQTLVREKIMSPAALVVVSQMRCEDDFRGREDYAATCCAIQNMLLAAKAEGLGSKWSTGALTQAPPIYSLLNIDESMEEIVGFIWLGEPKSTPDIERPEVGTHIRRLP